jgi:hypothetical protein
MIPQFTGPSDVLPAVMIPVKPAVMIPVKPAVMIPVKPAVMIPESTFSPLPGSAWQVGMVASPRRIPTPAFANVALDAMITANVMAATMFLKFVIVLILLNIFVLTSCRSCPFYSTYRATVFLAP